MRQTSQIAIVGQACRLPGANSPRQLWTMLQSGTCAVTRIPSDRWSLERYGHPRQNERGRSYTWAAGVLDDIWGFDAAAFGLSPREAEQMDPQQRLLLELTWEALEDAGIPPSSLAGSEVGVFVGASTTDHGTSKMADVASADGYFATGNAASILSNRISYVYDLNGPSFTVDTACSSSLVALDAAVQALAAGRIDTAIVGGVSILLTPFQFVNFSQASMLSRTGLCQAFSAKADGYVRSEGAGVVVLRTLDAVDLKRDRVHAMIRGVRVNSDGRTNGIALPSARRQAQLLQQLYEGEGIDPNQLAFVEAHGTGTPVGDPIEASALGEMLGKRRSAPLPIGSIKSNIGHMEAAAGLGGLIKAVLALEHDVLPASLHCAEANPSIDFEGLNLTVASVPVPLARGREPRLAGVSSYGFGGTNAHVVIGDAPRAERFDEGVAPALLVLSAHSRGALESLAAAYADRLDLNGGADFAEVAAAANHARDRLEERLVVPMAPSAEVPGLLRSYAIGGADAAPGAYLGSAVGRDAPVAFVYSGNGGQWVGMGRSAYRSNATFRDRFAAVDRAFKRLSGWSLAAAMNGEDLAERLVRTSVAQPLIYAIQSSATAALARLGFVPGIVLGHSVGEVAAAEAAGALDLEAAVRVIYVRSLHQELAFKTGGMAVLVGAHEAAEAAVEMTGVSVAAYNSPRAFTLSGSAEALAAVATAARSLKARLQKLDIAYPFHSPLVDPIRAPLLADLAGLSPRQETARFVSTVTGEAASGGSLDALYWWRNVREPVQFSQAVETAARLGARIFVEIGPSPILLSHINETLNAGDAQVAALGVLDRKEEAGDPFMRTVALAVSRGAELTQGDLLGARARIPDDLPMYSWQRKPFRLADTAESIGFLNARGWHPLVGARFGSDQLEWHGQIDTGLMPGLADHVVDGHILLPGSAFAEMALAVARDWLGGETATVADFEIHSPMILAANASRDVRCRLQPATGMVEIMSRARLGPATWQTHAVAKILHPAAVPAEPAVAAATAGQSTMSGDELYPLALASGLAYGDAFRLLQTATRVAPGTIVVDLAAGTTDERFGLDPMRVDACFHGLALLYRELASKGRLKPYVPVGAGELSLYRPGVAVARAHIEVVRADERTIVVHFTLMDGFGQPVARLYRMRFQAMAAFRSSERSLESIIPTLALATEPLAPAEGGSISATDMVAAARAAGGLADGEAPPSPDYVLMDGWATATAYGLFEVLAEDGRVDLGGLVAKGRLPQRLSAWCHRLLAVLERSGLVRHAEAGLYAVASGADLPDPKDILRALAADHPERSAELLLAARTGALVDAIAAGDADLSTPVTSTAIETFDYGGVAAQGSVAVLAATLDKLDAAWPGGRALRILQIGDGPLTASTARLAARKGAELTVMEPDRRRLERCRLALEQQDGIAFEGSFEKLPVAAFDLVIASQAMHRIAADRAAWTRVAAVMAPSAVLAVIEPETSVFRDLVFGLHAAMADLQPDTPGFRLGPIASEAGWARTLTETMELTGVVVLATKGTDYGLFCIGQKGAARPTKSFKGEALVVSEGRAVSEVGGALATMLRFSGLKTTGVTAANIPAADLPDTIVYLAEKPPKKGAANELATRCLALKAFIAAVAGRKMTLWIVCPGATRAEDGSSAVEAGLWCFARTLANEYPSAEVKLVDLVPDLPSDVAARRLRDVVLSGTAETEIVVDVSSTRVVRFDKLPAEHRNAIPASEAAVRLVKGDHGGGLDRLHWQTERRRSPEAGEVEIAVEAAGLNFRDVMWGLSILPEEILEDGYAGATLGLECAGRVVRVGSSVSAYKVGDPVLAFAKAALATHVTVPTGVVAPVPQGLSMAAAATVPVAFLTAYYALIRCAHLREEEWVLIHGGAGGVGLAAMQIARWRGARIIATAGTTERRDLLIALGAEHVFDSRSNQFVDDIRQVTGSGVDVVLNSLSGEAMERSIAVLKPFGRFLELGKRDYVANSHIGLKPFRRNLSYFGIDLDQLILKDDTTGQALFEDVMGLFEEDALSPLPYRTVAASESVEAFRIMQRSGHVGKIVILPPAVPQDKGEQRSPFVVDADGVHLVTGGFGGFGLETARWLVDHGARHLALVGRSGAATAEAKAAVAAFEAAGVTVWAEALDMTDEAAVRLLVKRCGVTQPRLAGVIHAAAVIDDAIIANLTRAKLDNVLAAKVTGAEILDRLTRKSKLDYFILYSSATTVIGNPGQGAYVAANGYLEGLARARRKSGLPGLAVAWGAIQDVGILTRSGPAAINLLARSGVVGMSARAALDRLAEIMPQVQASSDHAVVTLAAVNWAAAREHLPVLRSKSFGTLMHGLQSSESGAKAKIKVKALVEKEGAAGASKLIVATVLEEIARILRLPKEDVSRNKPLMEIGLDSLMAVELGMGLEERFELDAPLSTSAGAMTVVELADYIVGTGGEGGKDQTSEDLALRHLDPEVRREIVDTLPALAGAETPRSGTVH